MAGPRLRRLRLVSTSDRDVAAEVARTDGTLALDFPTIELEHETESPSGRDVEIDTYAWRSASRFEPFDDAVRASTSGTLVIRGPITSIHDVAWQTLTRWQRFIARRNAVSEGRLFDRVLEAHAELHASGAPLVRADHDHALDTWQWLLRLDAGAALALQLAALFHDVERLESEAGRRVEHVAPDYQAFKNAHAARGAARAMSALRRAGIDDATAARAGAIIAAHEERGGGRQPDLLNDADALSFFSLNSSGYTDYFGPEQTRRKMAYSLARLGVRARRILPRVKLRPDVARLLGEVQ